MPPRDVRRAVVRIPLRRCGRGCRRRAAGRTRRRVHVADDDVDLIEHWALLSHRDLLVSRRGSLHASRSASGSGFGPGRRGGCSENTAGKHEPQLAVVVDRDHAALAEVRVLPHLLGVSTGVTGAPAAVSRSTATSRGSARARGGHRGLALVEPVEPFEVRRARRARAMPSAVAHGLPEVVLGDHAERDPAAVGAAEHAVAGRAARRLRRGPRSRCPSAARPRRDDVGHRDVDALAFAGAQPFAHAAQIASAATVAGREIGDRHASGSRGRRRAFARAIAPASAW